MTAHRGAGATSVRRTCGWGGLLRDRRGIAAIEAGLTLSVLLVPLLAGLAGVGQAMLLQYRVDRATHMALLYGWGSGSAATTTGLTTAATAGFGTGTGPALTPTASLACYCVDPTGTRTSSTSSAIACTGTCSTAGQVVGKWATVSSSATFTPVLIGAWNGGAWTIQNTSTVRIQ